MKTFEHGRNSKTNDVITDIVILPLITICFCFSNILRSFDVCVHNVNFCVDGFKMVSLQIEIATNLLFSDEDCNSLSYQLYNMAIINTATQ